jgi:hypothetical protein
MVMVMVVVVQEEEACIATALSTAAEKVRLTNNVVFQVYTVAKY